jgi:DNA replication protein DnaC
MESMKLKQMAINTTNGEILSFNYHKHQQNEIDYLNSVKGGFDGYDCPKCLNRGYIAVLTSDDGIVCRECECKPIRKSIIRLRASGIEQQIKECHFDNFKTDEQYQSLMKSKAERYLKSDGWFITCGQSGCGKTHICTAIVGELIKSGKACIYMSYREEITKLKQEIGDGDEYQKQMDKFKTIQILYIDDFFKGKITEADINAMFELINYRYINKLQTIISTELMFDKIMEIDQAIAGRIKQQAGDFLIQIFKDDTKNFRLR